MKVFFTASQRGKRKFGIYYKTIIKEIKRLGYTTIEDELFNMSTPSFYQELNEGGIQAKQKFYKATEERLAKTDIAIFDCSLHSLSIGFAIEKALELGKPTIVLYLTNHEPYFLEGITNDQFFVHAYTPKNIQSVVKTALLNARNHKEKRFNFFLSPKIVTFVEKRSKSLGMTKSTYMRGLIIDDMRKEKI